jgi:LPS export ABC transporter protein LptC
VRFRSRWLAVAIAAVIAGCGGRSAPAQQGPGSPGTPAAPTPTPLAIKVKSIGDGHGRVVLTEKRPSGRIVYVLHADANVSDRFGAGSGHSVFTRPHIVFYQESGKTLTAVSPTATVEEQTKTVLMSGGVRATTQDGIVLTCDTMLYDDRAATIHGEGHVVITTPRGERLNGDTLDADVQLNHVRVSSGAGS